MLCAWCNHCQRQILAQPCSVGGARRVSGRIEPHDHSEVAASTVQCNADVYIRQLDRHERFVLLLALSLKLHQHHRSRSPVLCGAFLRARSIGLIRHVSLFIFVFLSTSFLGSSGMFALLHSRALLQGVFPVPEVVVLLDGSVQDFIVRVLLLDAKASYASASPGKKAESLRAGVSSWWSSSFSSMGGIHACL